MHASYPCTRRKNPGKIKPMTSEFMNSTSAILVRPNLEHLPAYIEALRAGLHPGDHLPKSSIEMQIIDADPLAFYARLVAPLPTIITTPTKEQVSSVPTDSFWLIEANRLLGVLNVRHRLSSFLARYGGHIGYQTNPAVWGQGWGKYLLAQGLRHAREVHNLQQVLITCNDDNIGSSKVIEANGGREFRVTPHPFVAGKKLRLYWVATSPSAPDPCTD
jgi:predicted acetyltransferase